jgi:hypothetical protein
MNLDRHKAKYLGMLDTGKAIINVKQRYNDSFLISPPFVPEGPNISDMELREAMRKFSDLSSKDEPQIEESSRSQTSQISDKSPPLNPLEKVLLSNIIEKATDGVDKRTRDLGLHPSQMTELQGSLEEKGFIKTAYVDKKKLMELTPEGINMARKAGIAVKICQSKGGVEHRYWIDQTVQFLKNLDFKPVLEVEGIDIVDRQSGIAIEIETGKSDIETNIKKLFKSRHPHLFMLTTTKALELKLKGNSPIRVLFVKDFLKLTPKEMSVADNSEVAGATAR